MDVFLSRIVDLISGHGARQFFRRGIYWAVILIFFSSARANELFPIPIQIEKNVDFWTKIYSQYSSNHVVIHDKNDLSIIYKVINLNDFYPDSLDLHSKWEIVKDIKADYRDILQKLARLQTPVNLDSLTIEERHVYILWSQSDNVNKFYRAVSAVRAQLGLRDRFEESIRRSGYYKENIDEIFESYNLPLELTYLPHVESLFNSKSYSKVGAAGLWQFMRYTGRLFMTVNSSVDERLDPIMATDGAAQLLKRNYEELQSWPLAITAYNHGLGGMATAKRRHGTDDFGIIYENYKSSMFGFASKNFYAEFLAAWHVAENHESYFGDITPYPAIQYQNIKLHKAVYLEQLAQTFKVPMDTLIVYNPAFRRSVIRNKVRVPKGYDLRLPFREGFDPREALVQNTKPAPQHRKKIVSQKTTSLLFAHNAARLDSLKAAHRMNDSELENYLIKKLRTKSGAAKANSGKSDNFEQAPASLNAN